MLSPALSVESISQSLTTKRIGRPIVLHQHTDSTNSAALELAKRGTPDGTVVLSEQQSAGRGRHGRSWFSPSGTNIYCSIIILDQVSQDGRPPHLALVPLMTGVAVAHALHQTTQVFPMLKWPNDILIQKKKVGGILCERVGISSNHSCLVIGIGINVNMELAHFPEDLRAQATSLASEVGQCIDRNLLVASLLTEIESTWDSQKTEHPLKFLQTYRQLCTTLGAFIRVEMAPGKTVEGLVLAIGDDGALHLQQAGASPNNPPLIIRSGEVIHIREQNE